MIYKMLKGLIDTAVEQACRDELLRLECEALELLALGVPESQVIRIDEFGRNSRMGTVRTDWVGER